MPIRLGALVRTGAVMVMGLVVSASTQTQLAVGAFTASQDIGTPSTVGAGSAKYDPATKTYTIAGGGVNMWSSSDHFHYVWKKVSGDALLAATIEFVATHPATGTPDPHRKAVLVVRQSLDADSVYADAAVHGDGLTSLQWRDVKGGPTRQIESMAIAPRRVRFEKRGNYVSMSVGGAGEELKPAGGSTWIDLQGEYYIGLGVTAHNTGRIETATFSDVELTTPPPPVTSTTQKPAMVNTLETINVRSKDRRVAYVVTQPTRIEAPNWYPDASNTLYFNTNGRLYRIQADPPGAKANPNRVKVPEAVDLGFLTRINNDHGITNDGKLWAISDQSQTVNGQRPSLLYTVPFGGGQPKLVTEKGPSYFHGWSPDGKTLTYCAQRDGNFDIYTVSVDGGAETRLTTDKGKDDGPEYSPDGQYIYFNSDRSGAMQIWRMKIDGTQQEQITNDDQENWFPHVAPNGQSIAFLTYAKGVGDHPDNKDVMLRVMDLVSRKVEVLTRLFGGQGTINVPSWSPNSQYLAFVSYQLIPQ